MVTTIIASTDTAPREVRRNRASYPGDAPTNTAGWAGYRTSILNPGGFIQATTTEQHDTGGGGLVVAGAEARFAVTPGEVLQLSAELRGDHFASTGCQFYDAGGMIISGSQSQGASVALSSGWQVSTHTVTVPEGAATCRPAVFRVGQTPVGAVLDMRRWTAGGLIPFSGNYSPDPELIPSWTGAVNASESILTEIAPVVEVTPQLVDGWEASREVRNVVHTILNRPDPDVTLRASGLRSGRFRLLFPEQADALTAFAGLTDPHVFTITDPDVPAVDMTFVVAEPGGDAEATMTLDDETRSVWWVEVPFTEVIP